MAHPVGECGSLKEIRLLKSEVRIFGINRANVLSGPGENQVGIFLQQSKRAVQGPRGTRTENINVFSLGSDRIPIGAIQFLKIFRKQILGPVCSHMNFGQPLSARFGQNRNRFPGYFFHPMLNLPGCPDFLDRGTRRENNFCRIFGLGLLNCCGWCLRWANAEKTNHGNSIGVVSSIAILHPDERHSGRNLNNRFFHRIHSPLKQHTRAQKVVIVKQHTATPCRARKKTILATGLDRNGIRDRVSGGLAFQDDLPVIIVYQLRHVAGRPSRVISQTSG